MDWSPLEGTRMHPLSAFGLASALAMGIGVIWFFAGSGPTWWWGLAIALGGATAIWKYTPRLRAWTLFLLIPMVTFFWCWGAFFLGVVVCVQFGGTGCNK